MNNLSRTIRTTTALLAMMLLASATLSLAANNDKKKPGTSTRDAAGHSAPAKPASAELAVKREMVRKQQEQRVTHQQRKTGAKALQAERKRVYDAKQAVAKAKGAGENKSQ